jgi:hypothetical protein
MFKILRRFALYIKFLPLFFLFVLSLGTPVFADEVAVRHGSVLEGGNGVTVEGGLTATAQRANDERARSEILGSFDLVSTLSNGLGTWTIYVEGSTSPRAEGVSSRLGEANADAGTALDRDGKGRLQVSELYYMRPIAGIEIYAGLLDATGFFDASDVANDETTQFLGASFVNNPSIIFPDYTLGIALHREPSGHVPGLTVFLGSSHGLADNPRASYAELVEVQEQGKGVFAAAELYWQINTHRLRLGVWNNSADYVRLDESDNKEYKQGIYTMYDGQLWNGRWNLRVGIANQRVSEIANFTALALEYPVWKITAGLGLARVGSSKYLQNSVGNTVQAEFYARVSLPWDIDVTASVQMINNSGFDHSGDVIDSRALVYSMRLGYTF